MRASLLALAFASWSCHRSDATAAPNTVATAAASQACAQIQTFADAHGWSALMEDCFYDEVAVYDTQANLFAELRTLHGLPDDFAFPPGVVGALEKRHLLVVSPAVYREIAPDYAVSDDAWTRLMAHEIGHRLHVAILDGDEDAMGPQWFYEGFAVVAAGQQLGEPLAYASAQEALAGVHQPGPLAYRRFGAAVRYFARNKAPLSELVERAADPTFEEWLEEP